LGAVSSAKIISGIHLSVDQSFERRRRYPIPSRSMLMKTGFFKKYLWQRSAKLIVIAFTYLYFFPSKAAALREDATVSSAS